MSPESDALRPDLSRLQRWMQEVVVHPGSIDEAIGSADAQREIPAANLSSVVLPSKTMTAAERLGVYHDMYLMRMEEALETDYPVIRYHLGGRRFAHLVQEYVESYPSTSYTLNRLGDNLPRFFNDRPDWPQASFLHELARFELAMTEVFDEAETPPLGPDDLEAVAPEAWPEARLRPIAALRILALRYSPIPHLTAYHDDRPAPNPRRRASWVALYRRDYTVLRLELSRAEFDLLSSLIDGEPLGRALEMAATSQKSARQHEKVFRWFQTWISEGLFTAIEAAAG